MEIKISLKQLTTLFIQSAANEELPAPIRQFAAQLTVLTAHVERVDAARQALATKTESHIAELAALMGTLPDAVIARLRAASAPPAAAAQQPTAETAPPMDDDADGEAMAARVIAETEAEAAALANGKKLPAVS